MFDDARGRSTYVISLTPFADDGSLDEGRLRDHLRRMARGGVGVFVAGSGSGEAYTLTDTEVRTVLDVSVEELKGKVPVRAMGSEPRTAQQMVDFIEVSTEAGVDAVQVYSLEMGHAASPAPETLRAYYDEVLSQAAIPVVLSSHFSVGYLLPIDLVVDLVGRYPLVTGINCTAPDIRYLIDLLDALDGRIEVHVGGPAFALSALALGATGYLSSEANVAPRLCRSLIDRFEAGDLDGAFDAYARIMRMFNVNMRHDHVSSGRVQLELLGTPVGPPRRPRLPLDEDARGELAAVLDELGIEEIEA